MFMNRDFDKHFDKQFDKAFNWIVVIWIVGVILSLALAGVATWAIVTLVLHFT